MFGTLIEVVLLSIHGFNSNLYKIVFRRHILVWPKLSLSQQMEFGGIMQTLFALINQCHEPFKKLIN